MNVINNIIKIWFILSFALFCLDFGYVFKNSNPNIRKSIKVFMVVLGLFFCVFTVAAYIVIDPHTYFKYWRIIVSVQYFLLSVVSILCGNEGSFHNLQISLKSIDLVLCATDISHKVDIKIVAFLILSFGFKLLTFTSFCFNFRECTDSGILNIINLINLLSYDIVTVILFFIFYSPYCRLSVFNKLVQNSGGRVVDFLKNYVIIVNTVEKSGKCFEYLYIVLLLFKLPDLVLSFYYDLIKLQQYSFKDYALHYATRYMYTAENFVLLSLPAISAGMLAQAVDELILILHEKLLSEREQNYTSQVENMIDYITARPMKFSLCKIVTLDFNLPVLLFHLCITYQIIIVQITQLY